MSLFSRILAFLGFRRASTNTVMSDEEVAKCMAFVQSVKPDPEHLKLVRWHIRNLGAKGFGPFAELQPRKIMEWRDNKWHFLDGFSEADIEN